MTDSSVNLDIAGKTLTLQTGSLAKQATSSVLARLGDTMVLATVVAGKERPDLGYFPLTVDYIERLYAGGKIKGSRWVKREGRPSDESILTARLIDRSIRPLFSKDYKKEVQVIVTLLSVDGENEPDILSVIAVSAALSLSNIPWNGPVGALRVGYIKENDNGSASCIINPPTAELVLSELDMVVTQTKEKTLMLEAGASQVTEEVILKSIECAHAENKKIIELLEKWAREIGQKKDTITPNTSLAQLKARIEKSYKTDITSLIKSRLMKESNQGGEQENVIDQIFSDENLADEGVDRKLVAEAVEQVFFKAIRENILKEGKRPDGRMTDEIRQISSSVSVLPRTHGSAIFQRGDTQALTVVTLGSPRLEQLIESAGGEEAKRYIHHYSMPPYSVGETGRMFGPSRREIGHGALAERAIMAVIPKQEQFPYTIRVVSEILSSNGSTSMAATCGSTLALMDAGVPIIKPVAGIAMGMVSNEKKQIILTDILGLEDFSGDMDFKVAGTDSGITAIQLDVKIAGITILQIKETLEKAKAGRLFILEKMLSVLPQSRREVSQFAPKIEVVHVPIEKIGEIIGPGGRVIRNIIAETGASVDVEDDGSVTVSGTEEEAVAKAVTWIQSLIREVQAGEEFEGEVKRILPFGAFVEILPGKEGMVHVSQMATGFVKDPNEVVKLGQKVKVRVAEIDQQGRINLSMVDKANLLPRDDRPRHFSPPQEQGQPHPLTMQFRRESAGWRSRNGRPGSRPPRRGFRPSR
ncbi:MAG: polyribonucleotide nucleotidyltransferase [Candidatus Levybacteria bacterium]|nr:polyribonucleotide nucleotidyltransferase [Candidatus Levybacteria bacterium]